MRIVSNIVMRWILQYYLVVSQGTKTMIKQRTIARPIEIVGIGLHKGKPVKLRLEPMEVGSGILFYRKDVGVTIPLAPEYVVDTQMATVIGKKGVNISTIEHFPSLSLIS